VQFSSYTTGIEVLDIVQFRNFYIPVSSLKTQRLKLSCCFTWRDCRLSVSENGVLRRIFGSKWEEVAGGCIMSFMNCTLHQVVSDDQMKEDEMGGHVVGMRKMRNSYKISVLKPGVKRIFGRSKLR
jgi:hypothetical protein